MTRQELIFALGSKATEKQVANICRKEWMKHDWNMDVNEWKRSFNGAFCRKTPGRVQIIDKMCAALGKDHVEWSDLTKVNLRTISDYLNENVSPNSASTYSHIIMALLNDYMEEGVLPVKSLTNTLKTKLVPSQHVALTPDELERFEAYEPKNRTERDVKCLFMRSCYTGARCSDVIKFSDKSIVGECISYVQKKTKIEVAEPMHAKLRKYLDYQVTKSYPVMTLSRTIHNICKAIGMTEDVTLFVGGETKTAPKYEFITMHSARRTFCTILAQMGVNVETIRSMAGHTNSSMTDRYICLDGRNPGKDAMKFFKGA